MGKEADVTFLDLVQIVVVCLMLLFFWQSVNMKLLNDDQNSDYFPEAQRLWHFDMFQRFSLLLC